MGSGIPASFFPQPLCYPKHTHLQRALVCRQPHHQPVPPLLQLWPLLAHHLSQQLILQALQKNDKLSNCALIHQVSVSPASLARLPCLPLHSPTPAAAILQHMYISLKRTPPSSTHGSPPTFMVTVKLMSVTLMQVSGR